jgi:hypothetical protein
MLVHSYRDGREVRYGSDSGLVLFRLVVHPLYPEVVEGVGSCLGFFGPSACGTRVQDPDTGSC